MLEDYVYPASFKVDDPAVGRRIRDRRFLLGLAQREVELPGCSYAYISRIENGQRRPSIGALVAIAERLDTTALWLMTGDVAAHCPICRRR